ncbi:MAG: exo-alpha-sialidase [Bryobacterales bacterium]|nr:exo-alpha-sialidase [Bryobacterales bacterium]
MITLAGLLIAAVATAAEPVQLDLWKQGDGGVHTYRIPALLETRKGALLAVVDARYDNSRDLPGRIALVMRTSRDKGKTWTPSRVIRQVESGGAGDASLLLDRKTGRVWCFYAYGPPGIGFPTAKPGARTGPETLQVHAMYSDDEGGTWSEAIDLTPQIKDPSWQAMFPTSGTHFQTSKGRYLVPVVVRHADKVVRAHNAYSDDAGKNWRIGPPIGDQTDESKAVELAGGVVLQNMRNGPRRAIARSTDGGVNFSAVSHDDALIDPSCNAGIAQAGKLLIFTNAASTKRERLTVKISADGGKTWPRAKVLHEGPAAYSTVVPLRDGTIAVLYERGDQHAVERITFARFRPDWVRQ